MVMSFFNSLNKMTNAVHENAMRRGPQKLMINFFGLNSTKSQDINIISLLTDNWNDMSLSVSESSNICDGRTGCGEAVARKLEVSLSNGRVNIIVVMYQQKSSFKYKSYSSICHFYNQALSLKIFLTCPRKSNCNS